jgi:hypothetical protein
MLQCQLRELEELYITDCITNLRLLHCIISSACRCEHIEEWVSKPWEGLTTENEGPSPTSTIGSATAATDPATNTSTTASTATATTVTKAKKRVSFGESPARSPHRSRAHARANSLPLPSDLAATASASASSGSFFNKEASASTYSSEQQIWEGDKHTLLEIGDVLI